MNMLRHILVNFDDLLRDGEKLITFSTEYQSVGHKQHKYKIPKEEEYHTDSFQNVNHYLK